MGGRRVKVVPGQVHTRPSSPRASFRRRQIAPQPARRQGRALRACVVGIACRPCVGFSQEIGSSERGFDDILFFRCRITPQLPTRSGGYGRDLQDRSRGQRRRRNMVQTRAWRAHRRRHFRSIETRLAMKRPPTSTSKIHLLEVSPRADSRASARVTVIALASSAPPTR